jgi:uncharacterized protein
VRESPPVPAPLLLLPPSQAKTSHGSGPPWHVGKRPTDTLDDARREVIAALRAAVRHNGTNASKLLDARAGALQPAIDALNSLDDAPTRAAVERYDGVFYSALDAGSLSSRDRRRLNDQALIFSGLWGVVAPNDPLPEYRCKLSSVVAPLGKLSTWWRPRLGELLEERSRGRVVWNLLAAEQDAACQPSASARHVIRVRFLDDVQRGDERRLVAVNHWNKLLKGSLARHVLATQLQDPEGLVAFSHPQGYRYRPDLTETRDAATTVCLVAPR